ncbi:DHA2 family efflux MFS transporter permease subunit [Labrys wisconsinensis]|uniref:DHA2 family multidrug resistance protein n=1 Tax=Labrys wisconsinensis TaxID=425677 RepID=A0ABU0JEK4_9HYPH|nr:DHA2 family efflux MFS transporter permease subunit [Labrys wisconsinensis]MDQ0472703.1 DHA2 family multidrug resistance protein [Labrys wisconsinensis]
MSAVSAADTVSASRAEPNPWLIAIVVTLAAFMEVLDTTIVNVALPHIAGTMSASTDESTWTLTSYLVANGIVLTISGFLTRLLGRKRYFLICIAMFTVCSFLCGIATSLPQIIIFRLMQGFFGGGLQPNQQSIILDTFPPAKRSQAFAVTALATVVAPVLGPTLGGLITDNYSWRWIFLINIPVGLLTFLGVMALVREPAAAPGARRKVSTDYVGLGLIVLGLGAFQIMLDKGENADWLNSPFICWMAALAAIGIGGAICWLLVAKEPIVNLRALADRNFAVGCTMIVAMAVILYSSAVLLPQLSEQQLGYTATWAGLLLSPGAIALIGLIIVVGRILPLVQARFVIAFGFVFLGAAFLYSRNLVPDIDFGTLVKMRVFQTMGLGFLFVPISSIAYLTLPRQLNGDAAALFTMFRNVAGSIGISLSSALLTTRAQVHMAYAGSHLTPYSQPYLDTLAATQRAIEATGVPAATAQQSALGQIYQQLIDQSQLLAYMDVFSICALLAFCAAPLALLLSPVKLSGGGAAAH